MRIAMKKIRETSKLPTKGSKYAAGYDLYLDGDEGEVYAISPHTNRLLPTGVAMSIPIGYFGAIYARSGLSTKKGLRPANCVGVVDSDYRGEVMVPLYNDSNETRVVKSGERIAQIIFEECKDAWITEVKELDSTARNEQGFGSTGEK